MNKTENKPDKRRVLAISATEESAGRVIAEAVLGGMVGNASAALSFASHLNADVDLTECVGVVEREISAVNKGDLNKLEGMLTAQAIVLNAIFNNYAKKALASEYVSQLDLNMRIALKAQAQCRTTVEAIGEIKFPKSATFIRQQNVANQQQVNNGVDALAHVNPNSCLNGLLTGAVDAKLEQRGAGAASSNDSPVAAVGQINRAKDYRGKRKM